MKKFKAVCHNCLTPTEVLAIGAGLFIFKKSKRSGACRRCGFPTLHRVLPREAST